MGVGFDPHPCRCHVIGLESERTNPPRIICCTSFPAQTISALFSTPTRRPDPRCWTRRTGRKRGRWGTWTAWACGSTWPPAPVFSRSWMMSLGARCVQNWPSGKGMGEEETTDLGTTCREKQFRKQFRDANHVCELNTLCEEYSALKALAIVPPWA